MGVLTSFFGAGALIYIDGVGAPGIYGSRRPMGLSAFVVALAQTLMDFNTK